MRESVLSLSFVEPNKRDRLKKQMNQIPARRHAGNDRCGIGLRIDAQEARASVEDVRKVACPLLGLAERNLKWVLQGEGRCRGGLQ